MEKKEKTNQVELLKKCENVCTYIHDTILHDRDPMRAVKMLDNLIDELRNILEIK